MADASIPEFGPADGRQHGGKYASIDATLLLKILDNFKADALAQYVIGFVPASNASPVRRRLEVRVVKKSSGAAGAERSTDPEPGVSEETLCQKPGAGATRHWRVWPAFKPSCTPGWFLP